MQRFAQIILNGGWYTGEFYLPTFEFERERGQRENCVLWKSVTWRGTYMIHSSDSFETGTSVFLNSYFIIKVYVRLQR